MNIRYGDVYYADLSPVIGSEQGGVRPVLVIQNDIGNRFSPTVIVAAISTQLHKAKLPTHVAISAKESGLPRDSVILLEQVRVIDKSRLNGKISRLSNKTIQEVFFASQVSMSPPSFSNNISKNKKEERELTHV